MSLREYIEERCIPEPNSGCWLWLLSIGTHGYGQASMPGNRVTVAHRVSYMAFKGEIPDGMLVQHSCDNRICVNPDHLSLGTDKTNAVDKMRKGRANYEGRDCSFRFSPEQALAIRRAQEPHAVTARRFGVTDKTIRLIRQGRTHPNIPADTRSALLPLLPHQIEWVDALLAQAVANDEAQLDLRGVGQKSGGLEQGKQPDWF